MFPTQRIGLVLGLLIPLSCQDSRPLDQTLKIIGGRVAEDVGFMAGIMNDPKDETFCGGTFVAQNVVVTAAHCVVGNTAQLYILPGKYDESRDEQKVLKVTSVAVHPDYEGREFEGDIAVLIVEPNPDIVVTPLIMNESPDFPVDDRASRVLTVGRGAISPYGYLYENTLREVELSLVPKLDCSESYPNDNVNGDKWLCAGDLAAGGYDSCWGDSGGPLIADSSGVKTLVGVVSWGYGCAQKNNPGVYTRLSAYLPWVKQIIEASDDPNPDGEKLAQLFGNACYTELATYSEYGAVSETYKLKVPATFTKMNQMDSPKQIGDHTCSFGAGGRFQASWSQNSSDTPIKILDTQTGEAWYGEHIEVFTALTASCAESSEYLSYYPDDSSWVASLGGTGYHAAEAREDLPPGVTFKTCSEGRLVSEIGSLETDSGTQLFLRASSEAHPGLKQIRRLIPFDSTGSDDSGEADKSATLNISAGGTHLSATNNSTTDIFTWELQCDFEFTIHLGDKIKEAQSHGADSYRVRFTFPEDQTGAWLRKTTLEFALETPSGLPETPACSLNNIDTKVSVEP